MQLDQLATRVAGGAAAGLAATAVLHQIHGAYETRLPEAAAPIRQDPGEFMVQQAESVLPDTTREQIPERVEKTAAQSLHFGYGMTFGALYAALRPRGGNLLLDGVALGVATWAVGYLGWLPATGLMPPVAEQQPKQVLGPVLEHVVYGVAAVAAFAAVRRALPQA